MSLLVNKSRWANRYFRRLDLGPRGAPPLHPHAGSIGEDTDGDLFYAKYPSYDGVVSWVPFERWRWLTKRRVCRDLQRGDGWYVYQLEKEP